MKKIAIQGVSGCFHEVAAKLFFKNENVEIIPCETFKDVFQATKKDENIIAVVAIENTIAGSLLQNYELIRSSGLSIIGEHKLRIKHCICALEGQKIEDIKEVMSHPIALMQCGNFLDKHPHLKIVEHDDTASSAKYIAEHHLNGAAAICSTSAAKLYKLNILEEGIETNKHNFTRFLVLSHDTRSVTIKNRSSIALSIPHEAGALSKILTILSFYDINLTKIQSLPIVGKEWEYLFYIDLSFENYDRYEQSINAIKPLTTDLQILGVYTQGEQTI